MPKHPAYRWSCLTIFLIAATWNLFGQVSSSRSSPTEVRKSVRGYRTTHEVEILREFEGLLAIPNVATDHVNIRHNAEHIVAMLQKRGVEARLLNVANQGSPIVYGVLKSPGAKRTVLLYAHYDGQPVDASQWSTPPWSPTLRDGILESGAKVVPLDHLQSPLNPEWRIYARSAGDDKIPIQAVVSALDALKAANVPLTVNLKFLLEGEEEAGSEHLPDALHRYSNLLAADALLLCDGPVNQSRRMQLFFGARGEIGMEMTVYGPLRSLHDGHYGNWAPNPAAILTRLLAGMRDDNAHISVPGFYDDVRPLTQTELNAIQQIPDVSGQMRQELGLAWNEGGDEPILLRITKPAMNVRGIESGHVGDKAQNAIPTEAKASVDFRLVPDQDPQKIQNVVNSYIEKQGFHIVDKEPDLDTRLAHPRIIRINWSASAYGRAARTSMDDPAARAVITAVEQTLGTPVIKMPMLGGTVPMYLFVESLKVPVIGVPLANHDNNQHAANENLRLQNLWDGIEVLAGILSDMGNTWQ
ncbi:MAG TPA: M20/M25/M40 family metallo-hydrolase [Terriglobales bacterium]|jgi:acetylornithine deacetylase/succinyl-diaminopimelate desuccinylase-like protein